MATRKCSKRPIRVTDYPELSQVVTLAEAARLAYRDPKSLRYAIDTGHIAAVQCGRIWLVSVPSLDAHFGTSPQLSA